MVVVPDVVGVRLWVRTEVRLHGVGFRIQGQDSGLSSPRPILSNCLHQLSPRAGPRCPHSLPLWPKPLLLFQPLTLLAGHADVTMIWSEIIPSAILTLGNMARVVGGLVFRLPSAPC